MNEQRLRILLLTANPVNNRPLNLEDEHRLLRNMMRANMEAGNCELLVEQAARKTELLMALERYKPHIVHFAGHGDADGICLEDDEGRSRALSKEQLSSIFSLSLEHLRLVVLNACCSTVQMERLKQLVDYIVGTSSPIADDAAVLFTGHFYRSLAVGEPVREAFNKAQGKLTESHQKAQAEQYRLLIREGTDETKPLLPPSADSKTAVIIDDIIEAEKDINIGNVFNIGDTFSPGAGQPPNKKHQLDMRAKRVKAGGNIYIVNEKNEAE